MNPYSIISFIQNKRPQYKDPNTVKGLPQPIEGEGYIDEKGRQGKFVTLRKFGGKTISTFKNNQLNGPSITYRKMVYKKKIEHWKNGNLINVEYESL